MKESTGRICLAAALIICFSLAVIWFNSRKVNSPSLVHLRRPAGATNAQPSPAGITSNSTVASIARSDLDPGGVVGVGAQLSRPKGQNGITQIIGVLPGSPAEKAGLKPPLNVYAVDGVALTGVSLQDCVKMIRGAAGSKVRLELSAPEDDQPFTVELIRGQLQ
ncbi:MAG TPA: PDZ domain-containing protein [Candidatus Saccharimonadales bacterium]|nr:PDZ domain-containing protein [Candidatus Saccharimonadales bacterium]